MKKKYFSKKNNIKCRKKTKLRGGASRPKKTVETAKTAKTAKTMSSTLAINRQNNSAGTVSVSNSNIFYSASKFNLEEHYLLLGLDLIYNGIAYCWNPETRMNSVAGETIKLYKITKDSGSSAGGSPGRKGSGQFNLNKCNSIKEEDCSGDCVYKKGNNLCDLKDNFIICNKKCNRSKWYMLNLNLGHMGKKKILCLCFCWGTTFTEVEFENIWMNGFRDNLLEILNFEGYNQLMINGHSMGAGLSYLVTIKMFEDKEFSELIMSRIGNFENLYLHLFGMGRLPTISVVKFKEYYEKFKFNVYDIISYCEGEDGSKKFDTILDNVKVISKDCDYLKSIGKGVKPEFYCLNFSDKRLQDKSKLVNLTNKKLPPTLTTEQSTRYEHCLTKEGWGEIYSPQWENCQELLDRYHLHTLVNTYLIDNNGNLIKEDKNKMSFNRKIVQKDVKNKDSPSGVLHAIKTYRDHFVQFYKK